MIYLIFNIYNVLEIGVCVMIQKTTKKRKSYPKEFKVQTIELAKELSTKMVVEKLGIKNFQTLAAWVRYGKKMFEDEEFRSMGQLRVENKKLRKELADQRTPVFIPWIFESIGLC